VSIDPADTAAILSRDPVAPDATLGYGGAPDQVVDLWFPAPGRPAPVVLLLHGGFWRQPHDRRHLSALAAHLARRGAVAASVEYRRVGGAGGWPETFDDVALAVDTVPTMVRKSGVDAEPGRTVLVGHSAGGHLALWATLRHRLPATSRWYRPAPPPVAAVVGIAPVADLAEADRLALSDHAVAALLGGRDRVAERIAEADPARLLPTGLPTTLVHGSADGTVPLSLSERFARAAGGSVYKVDLVVVDGAGHYDPIDPDTAAAGAVERAALGAR
jgi:acetyl esterase/lipase